MPPCSSPLPFGSIAALALAALLAGALPGGDWSVATALLAAVAALVAGHERRYRDMLVAAGIAAGLAPAGLLVAPLCFGWAFARGAARHLPIAGAVAGIVTMLLPWPAPTASLPNLAVLATAVPDSLALVAAIGAGCAAWIAARAASCHPADGLREARLGILVLAGILPLPLDALGLVLMLAALPLPHAARWVAANDNMRVRRVAIRLAA